MAIKDYYSLLGLPRSASANDVRRAYRQLVLRLHPDKNPGNYQAEELFKSVSEAYQVLSNPLKRKDYDLKTAGLGEPVRAYQNAPRASAAPPPSAPKYQPKTSPTAEKKENAVIEETRRPRRKVKGWSQDDYQLEANEFEEADVVRGIIFGAVMTPLLNLYLFRQTSGENVTVLTLASFAPVVLGPFGYQTGKMLGDALEEHYLSRAHWSPFLETFRKFLPCVGALLGCWLSLRASFKLGISLPVDGLIPASISAGLASAGGAGMGRAFVLNASTPNGRFLGIGVGGFIGVLIGGLSGALLVVVGVGSAFGPRFYDFLLSSAAGGAFAGAVSAILGSRIKDDAN